MLLVKLSEFLNQEPHLKMVQVMTNLDSKKLHVLQISRFLTCDSHHTLPQFESMSQNVQEMPSCCHDSNHTIHDSNHISFIQITNCLSWIKHRLQPLKIGYMNVIWIRGFHDLNNRKHTSNHRVGFSYFLNLDSNHLISWLESYSLLMTQIK